MHQEKNSIIMTRIGAEFQIRTLRIQLGEVAVHMKPNEYEQARSLGEAALVAKTQGAAIGNGEIYLGAIGSPAVFYVLDALTGQVKFSEAMPGHDVIWAVTIGSDSNVYLSGTHTGILFRYRPLEQKLEQVGINPSNPWVWDLDASSDGYIYGSTYPESRIFVYDIHSSTFTDMGTVMEGQDYARGSGVTDRYLYAGIGTKAYLFRYDRATGDKLEIQLPITGKDYSISNVWSYGNRLFVAYGTSLLVLDETSYTVIHQLDWQSVNAFD
ncbi:MAG: hypothetical protein K0R67_824, partial [Paenibacillus sp.]|nr:hypothetical protein [Paenibacillus sp.]